MREYNFLPPSTSGRTQTRTADLVLIRIAHATVTPYKSTTYISHKTHQMVQNAWERCNERCKSTASSRPSFATPFFLSHWHYNLLKNRIFGNGFVAARRQRLWPKRGQGDVSRVLPQVVDSSPLPHAARYRRRHRLAPAYIYFCRFTRLPHTPRFLFRARQTSVNSSFISCLANRVSP